MVNPSKSDPDDSVSPTYSNQTVPVPLVIFKNLEKSPNGSRPSTSEVFKLIPWLNIPLELAFGFSKAQNSKLGFQKIAVSFGPQVRVRVLLLSDFYRLI